MRIVSNPSWDSGVKKLSVRTPNGLREAECPEVYKRCLGNAPSQVAYWLECNVTLSNGDYSSEGEDDSNDPLTWVTAARIELGLRTGMAAAARVQRALCTVACSRPPLVHL